MEFFVDTAEVKEIQELQEFGLVDGVTTNPSLIAKSGRDFKEVVADICGFISGPVSAEVAAMGYDTMIKEAEVLAGIAGNVVIKLPLTWDGLKTCRYLSERNIQTNVTLCFSANQALLAAKSGATYISPFIGRLDDMHIDGMDLIHEIRLIYDQFDFQTKILAASIRNANHVKEAALAGANVATVPPAVIKSLVHHPLTEKGLVQFEKDWETTGQSIL